MLENETIELFVRLITSSLSFPFMHQAEFTALEKFLINRQVPPLFKSNLLLLRQVTALVIMLLLFIKIKTLPLQKIPKSWSFRSIILDNAIFMFSLVSYSLNEEITFLIF